MDCNCINYLVPTDNYITTDINHIKYQVYICENCKKYYVKHFKRWLGVEYNYKDNKWIQNKDVLIIKE